MSDPCCDIFAKFGAPKNEYHANASWVAQVRPKQVTLGSSVLIARRHLGRLSELNAAELADFGEAVRTIESRLSEAFRYDRINYFMLMMVDPHLHFHVIPRYAEKRTFNGIEWSDPAWPKGPPDLKKAVTAPDAVEAIRDTLRRN